MRAEDLELRSLLAIAPRGGRLELGGARAPLTDALALGLLRKQLIAALGLEGARCLLTQVGDAHGWRSGAALQGAFAWDSERDGQRAGARLHPLEGLVRVEVPHGFFMNQDVDLWAATLAPGQALSWRLRPGRHAWLQVARGRGPERPPAGRGRRRGRERGRGAAGRGRRRRGAAPLRSGVT